MSTKSIRLNEQLITEAKRAGALQHRTAPNQVEFWATLGRMMSSILRMEDVLAIMQGLKKINIESIESTSVDSDSVFADLEADRANGFKNTPVTNAPFFFEVSLSTPGLLDKVNTETGERETGKFENGNFIEVRTAINA